MGVKNLWDILEPCRKKLPLEHLQNSRVCIDLSCWMVQLHSVNKSHCPLKEKLYLKGLFHRLRALIALNCSLIFVSDGSIPALKLDTYRRRLKSACEVTKEEADLHKGISLKRNMGSEFSCMIKEAKALGLALGIPCLDGIEEAEAQCALLNSESQCDGCFSSDSDIFLFGAKRVYREICIGDGGYVVCYDLEDIHERLGFGRNSLIALAVLLGCDYSHGVRGVGPDAACRFIKSIGEDAILQHLIAEGISFLKKKPSKKQTQQLMRRGCLDNDFDCISRANGTIQQSGRDEHISEVINAFLKPKCHPADSVTVYRALSVQPLQQMKLQQMCAHFFEWPPEKTDEYVLPKIVERDLRRFAILRASSSILGTKITLEEMPVKCPISGIVKRRKVQGRECFEVEWERSGDCKTSIVPADLVESACPEKILEFEQKRDEKMKKAKRKPKSRKNPLKDKDALAELDLQLQNLVLDIESASGTCSTMNNRGNDRDPGVTEHHSFHLQHPGVVEMEVIDLLSPSPKSKQHDMSKLQGKGEHQVFYLSDSERSPEHSDKVKERHVIDLSDSEFERSTAHVRKTKELRSFLARRR